jgi:3-oxoacyl-[acyl-carrier-protein] synthase-3
LPKAKISALGCYVPPRLLTNFDLEKMVDTSNEWILERTGIVERHIAAPDVATSDMAVEAARVALAQRGIEASDLDALLVCTVTPDMYFPSTACLVQHRLGAKKVWGFDLIAACSSFLYGMGVGAHLVMAGTHKKVLVIGADTMSRIIDYTDRSTCILFGDGAGAMLIEPSEDDNNGLIDFLYEIDGCPPVEAACRPRMTQWRRNCTMCIRTARRCSSTPCARCTKLAVNCLPATT